MIDPRQPDYRSTPGSDRRPGFGYEPRGGTDGGRPLVTVLTPFYNTGAVFHETARSVFAQSLQNWEWVIVNDASDSPESLTVLDEYRRRDPRIRVIDLAKNRGPAARNDGFAAARAEYVFQLDSDDLIEPTTLEKCLWFLHTHPQYAFAKGYSVGFGAQEYMYTRGFHDGSAFLRENLASITAMVRKDAWARAGGYDDENRCGLEDWDFWLRCAEAGLWGATVPEFLDWYRRRETHATSWSNWDRGAKQQAFTESLREKYPRIFGGAFPHPEHKWHLPYEAEPDISAITSNPLRKSKPRLLMVAPWLRMGGADKWNLDLVRELTARGWEVTIATTTRGSQTWLPEFARYTPDIFTLHHFLRPSAHPAFIRYLIESREPDVVLVTNSELGYLCLPHLRAECPDPLYVDYVHMEEEHWKHGGFGRYSASSHDQLDYTMVTSEHLKRWLVSRGCDADRVGVAYINVDHVRWTPDAGVRRRVRAELGIPEDRTLILYAGRLTAQKQPRVFADTMRELAKKGAAFTALVAGDGEDRAFLEDFLDREGLRDRGGEGGCVRMLGETSGSRTAELMLASDIFFLPSMWEGIACVLYEAMAAGVAFVGADVGGHREVGTPGCAVLLPKASHEEEVRRYTGELLRLIADPAEREAMGRRARERIVARHTLTRMTDDFLAGLERASGLRATAPRRCVPRGLGREIAARAVEYLRAYDLGDALWTEREQLRHRASHLEAELEAHRAAAHAFPGGPVEASTPSPFGTNTGEATPAGASIVPADPASAELAHIEGSRAWRLVESLKSNPLYRTLADFRFGPGWDRIDPREGASVRLARIKASRSYKLIQSLKRTEAYRRYARSRYGHGPF